MKLPHLGDIILVTVCGLLIIGAAMNINTSDSSSPSPKIEKIGK